METTESCRLPLAASGERLALWKAAGALTLPERLHLAVRFRSAPWNLVVQAFAPSGDILDVGCGPGLLAYLLRRGGFSGSYLGIDPDPRKVARARAWLGGKGGSRFEVELDSVPSGAFSQVAILDVLYLVPVGARPGFVAAAAARLRREGSLVALTSGGGPPWKRRLDRCQERLAVWTGVTRGEGVVPCDGDEVARLFREAGLTRIAVTDIGVGYAHGFELVTARLGARFSPRNPDARDPSDYRDGLLVERAE